MKKSLFKLAFLFSLFPCFATEVMGDMVLINEFNAVGSNSTLGNSNSDPTFGTATGNGGNWFELIVVGTQTASTVDMRGWKFNWVEGGTNGTITLSQNSFWQNVQRGTLLTIIETANGGGTNVNTATDLSFNAVNDWHVNISTREEQAKSEATRLLSTTTNDGNPGDFSVGNNGWALTILDAQNNIVTGPIGEAIVGWGGGGISSSEVGKLEVFSAGATLNDWLTPGATLYGSMRDGTSSTFGQENLWSSGTIVQDFGALRVTAIPEPSTLVLLTGVTACYAGMRRRKRKSAV